MSERVSPSSARPSWGRDVFDRIYDRADDPWEVATSPYERAKYDATLAALPHPRLHACLEVGCSIGLQTIRLAERCDSVLGIDIAPRALALARARCAHLAHVRFDEMHIPGAWPPGRFDLIVLSEVLYFLNPDDIGRTARHVVGSLQAGGAVILVNWTGTTDTPTTGDAAAAHFIATAPDLRVTLHRPCPNYRLDRLER